jgi:ribonuclease Z
MDAENVTPHHQPVNSHTYTFTLTFLGTSSGIPTLSRNVSSVALQISPCDVWLVDCGDGTQRQLLTAGIPFARVRGVFITHLHGDHCYGLVPLLAMISMVCPKTEQLFVVGPVGIAEFITQQRQCTDLHLSYQLDIIELQHHVTHDNVRIPTTHTQPFNITACPLKHRVPCFGYVFREIGKQCFDAQIASKMGVSGRDLGLLARGESVTISGVTITKEQCMGAPLPARLIGKNIVMLCKRIFSRRLINSGSRRYFK